MTISNRLDAITYRKLRESAKQNAAKGLKIVEDAIVQYLQSQGGKCKQIEMGKALQINGKCRPDGQLGWAVGFFVTSLEEQGKVQVIQSETRAPKYLKLIE